MSASLPYKISVLLFIRDFSGRLLLMKRKKEPNLNLWSGIGGKLEMAIGESPFECAIRESYEEVRLQLTESDLHLFCMIAEKNYEPNSHWLMFLFDCKKAVPSLPPDISEGEFGFHDPNHIYDLPIPQTDREGLWPTYFEHRHGFVAMRANCHPHSSPEILIEERL